MNKLAKVQNPKLNYFAGGGMSSTASEYAQRATTAIQQNQQRKIFESALKARIQGANAAYEDAVKVYGDEISNWIPRPEMFSDDETGTFMPYKYYQAMATGIKEYKKQKLESDKAAADIKREDRMAGHQQIMEEQGQARLDQGERRIQSLEAGQMVSASRAAETERRDREKERTEAAKSLKNEIGKYDSDIRQLIISKKNAFDDQQKEETDSKIKNLMKRQKDAMFELKHLTAEDEGISDEAIKAAIDIQNAADGVGESPAWLQTSVLSQPGIGKPEGQSYKPEDAYSPMANYLYIYAQRKNARSVTMDMLEQLLATESPEKIIQGILNLGSQPKSKSIGK